MGEMIMAGILTLVGVGVVAISLDYPVGDYGTGAGTLPLLLGTVLVVLSASVLVGAWGKRRNQRPAAQPAPVGSFRNALRAVIALLGFVAGIQWLGYPLATVLFVPAYVVVVYRRNWRMPLVWGILVGVGSYLLFGALGVDLPAGALARR